MKHSLIAILIVFIGFTSCTSRKIVNLNSLLSTANTKISTSANPLKLSDALALCIEASKKNYQPKLGLAKRTLIRSGGVATAVNVIGTGVTASLDNEKNKVYSALVTGIVGAIIGAYQIWKGAERDAVGYVQESGEVLGKYLEKKVQANTDSLKTEAAKYLFAEAARLQKNYAEYADFDLINPNCSSPND